MKKVLVALSGGVDSAVCAYLLKEQGYEIEGATLVLHDMVKNEVEEAKKICVGLGIKHHVFEFKKEFTDIIIKDFIDNYISAKTPNPCIICNEKIKFGLLLEKAKELGCEKLATGHYVQIEKKSDIFYLKKPVDIQKDQSYVLYRLDQKQLSSVLFPLGQLTKSEVRQFALKANISSAKKSDSQENCFIDGEYSQYLLKNIDASKVLPGDIYDINGKDMGRKHKGLIYYTIGQRSGLGLTTEKPVYVISMDAKNNALIVGYKEDTYSKEMFLENIKWTSGKSPDVPIKADIKIRRMHKPASAEIFEDKIVFDEPQGSITPGQSAVFYKEDLVIGGGFIK